MVVASGSITRADITGSVKKRLWEEAGGRARTAKARGAANGEGVGGIGRMTPREKESFPLTILTRPMPAGGGERGKGKNRLLERAREKSREKELGPRLDLDGN